MWEVSGENFHLLGSYCRNRAAAGLALEVVGLPERFAVRRRGQIWSKRRDKPSCRSSRSWTPRYGIQRWDVSANTVPG